MKTQQKSRWRIATKFFAAAVTVSVPLLALTLFSGSAKALLSDLGVGPEFRVLEPSSDVQAKAPSAAPAQPSDDPTVVEIASWENTGNGGVGNGNGNGNSKHQ